MKPQRFLVEIIPGEPATESSKCFQRCPGCKMGNSQIDLEKLVYGREAMHALALINDYIAGDIRERQFARLAIQDTLGSPQVLDIAQPIGSLLYNYDFVDNSGAVVQRMGSIGERVDEHLAWMLDLGGRLPTEVRFNVVLEEGRPKDPEQFSSTVHAALDQLITLKSRRISPRDITLMWTYNNHSPEIDPTQSDWLDQAMEQTKKMLCDYAAAKNLGETSPLTGETTSNTSLPVHSFGATGQFMREGEQQVIELWGRVINGARPMPGFTPLPDEDDTRLWIHLSNQGVWIQHNRLYMHDSTVKFTHGDFRTMCIDAMRHGEDLRDNIIRAINERRAALVS